MSKEETPITAEEWLKQRSIDNGSNHNWKDPSNDPRTSDLMEQFTQAKVLEVLSDVRSVGENSERLLDKIDELISEL